MRAIFFDEDDATAVVARLRADGFEAHAERERLAGEDDDEDHPWAVLSDAPPFMLELLVERVARVEELADRPREWKLRGDKQMLHSLWGRLVPLAEQ